MSGLAAQAAFDDGSMCEYAGESLVDEFHGGGGQQFSQSVDEGRDAHHVLAVLPVELPGPSYEDAFYGFASHVVQEVSLQVCCGHGAEPVCDDLHGVGDCQPRPLLSVVDGENAHIFN